MLASDPGSAPPSLGTSLLNPIRVIDSHTAGEPTRVVLDGGPDLGRGPLDQRLARLRLHYDHFRSAVACEPRGSQAMVGALLCPPVDPACATGVLFFNDVGYLGMCGHGTIGVVSTLARLGRIGAGRHALETPVGVVHATLNGDGSVTVENVPSYRYARNIAVRVAATAPESATHPDAGSPTGAESGEVRAEEIRGDIAWGGNWFFIVRESRLRLEPGSVLALTGRAIALRQALANSGITGASGEPIDHIEYCAAPLSPSNHARNFVLCPGASFDRSPCGTGTSAKLACLAADGLLQPGEQWRQEGILGTVFNASYTVAPPDVSRPGAVLPSITGTAYITAEAELVFQPGDPFAAGILF
jgi:4-hydroxyproline epimerase